MSAPHLSTRQTWTAREDDGVNHLGLWWTRAFRTAVRPLVARPDYWSMSVGDKLAILRVLCDAVSPRGKHGLPSNSMAPNHLGAVVGSISLNAFALCVPTAFVAQMAKTVPFLSETPPFLATMRSSTDNLFIYHTHTRGKCYR